MSSISEKKYYGTTILIDVLRGSKSKKIISAGLDEVKEYGTLCGFGRDDLSAIIEWLIENHFILQTKGPYPVLHPTYDGIHYDETMTSAKMKKLLEYLKIHN